MVSQKCLRTTQFHSHISISMNKSQSIVWNYFQNKKNYKYELRKGSFKAFNNSLGKHKYYIQQNEYYIWILKRKHKNYFQMKLQSVRAQRGTLSSIKNSRDSINHCMMTMLVRSFAKRCSNKTKPMNVVCDKPDIEVVKRICSLKRSEKQMIGLPKHQCFIT